MGCERQTRSRCSVRPHRRGRTRADRTASARQTNGGIVGIPRRQGGAGRAAGDDADPRAQGGARHRGRGAMSRAADIRQPHLPGLPSADAALCVPALARTGHRARARRPRLGAAQPAARLSDAAGRRAADLTPDGTVVNATRQNIRRATMTRSETLVHRFLRDKSGATAIEYGLIAAGIGGTVAATIWNVGADVKSNLYDKVASMFD